MNKLYLKITILIMLLDIWDTICHGSSIDFNIQVANLTWHKAFLQVTAGCVAVLHGFRYHALESLLSRCHHNHYDCLHGYETSSSKHRVPRTIGHNSCEKSEQSGPICRRCNGSQKSDNNVTARGVWETTERWCHKLTKILYYFLLDKLLFL